MKKVVLFSLGLMLISLASQAAIHDVNVANFQFTPATIPNVFVGDVITWHWVGGSHTTTNDPSQEPTCVLPAGAATWDNDIRSSSTTFSYTVTVAGTYHYVCIPHAPNMAGDFVAQTLTPIKLTTLVAEGSGKKVSVKWGTEAEVNTDYFVVRRSANGSDFEEIAKVPAAGNSSSLKSYSFADNVSAKQKYYYYNVAVVDKDGKKIYSEVKLYKNSEAPVHLINTLSPNPISRPGHLNLTFDSETEGEMNVLVADASGKIIFNTKMYAVPGVNRGHVHLGNLASGTYTLVASMNGVKESHQLIYR